MMLTSVCRSSSVTSTTHATALPKTSLTMLTSCVTQQETSPHGQTEMVGSDCPELHFMDSSDGTSCDASQKRHTSTLGVYNCFNLVLRKGFHCEMKLS